MMRVEQNQELAYFSKAVQSGPLLVRNGVIAPTNGLKHG